MAPNTTTEKAPATPATKALADAPQDQVVMASRRADGTPDQTPGFEYIGDKETTLAATKEQLATSAVSAVDAARHRAAVAESAGSSDPDPVVAEDIKAKEQAVKAAVKAAEAEVNARFDSKA